MKKALLGSTALVAAGLVAQNAHAADPISLSIGGWQNWAVYAASYENDSGVDSMNMLGDAELVLHGSTVLDNGLEVGVRFELEGEQSGDQMDETWLQLAGSFGTVRIGNHDKANAEMATTAPYASFFFGLNTGTFSVGDSGYLSTVSGGYGDQASIVYFSPVFNGIQFAASYSPEAGAEAGDNPQPEGGEVWSIAGRYDGEAGGVGISASAGYVVQDVPGSTMAGTPAMPAVDAAAGWYRVTAGTLQAYSYYTGGDAFWDHDNDGNTPSLVPTYIQGPDGNPDGTETDSSLALGEDIDVITPAVAAKAAVPKGPDIVVKDREITDWNVGLQLHFGNASIGGSYRVLDEDKDDDVTSYDIGVRYGEGAWAVSAAMGNEENDSGTMDNDFYRLTANYDLGAGVGVTGVIGMNRPLDDSEDAEFAATVLSVSF